MSMSDPLNHLGPTWYHSEPSDVPYSPNQFLGWDFFSASYNKTALMNFFVIRRQASMINCLQQKMFLAEDEHRCMNGLLMINVDTMVKVIIYKSHKVSCFYVTEFYI